MNLPLVVSATAMKIHSIQFQNVRERCLQQAYLKKYNVSKTFEANLKSSKAHLHNRKKSTRRKGKRSSRLEADDGHQNDSKAKELEVQSHNKRKTKQDKPQAPIPTKSRSTSKTQTLTNPSDLNSSSNAIICSVRKLISSYSTKRVAAMPQNGSQNSKISPRAQTSLAKKSSEDTSEIKIKRQSCPPPLFQPLDSSASKNKPKKVYYSEAQSTILAGIPRVPPTSPLNDDFSAVDIVPCLADIKSQQTIKTKLRCLVTQRQRANEKIREKILKEEKRKEREQIEHLKQQRRTEIYALNEVMTEHERNKFLQFMKEKNNGTTVISLNV